MSHVSTNHEQGFTLFEVIIVIGIIAIVAVLTLPNLLRGRFYKARVQEEVDTYVSVLKKAQSMSIAQEKNLPPAGFGLEPLVPEGGYGIYVPASDQTEYTLFGDFDNNKQYSANEKVETFYLTQGMFQLAYPNHLNPEPLTIVFPIPQEEIFVNGTRVLSGNTVLTLIYTQKSQNDDHYGFIRLFPINNAIDTGISTIADL